MPDPANYDDESEWRKALAYDPETGHFTWLITKSGRGAKAGSRAGTVNGSGYRQIKLGQRIYGEHRLAFRWMTGRWPARFMDHVNGDPSDNRWSNLREATDQQNTANSRRWSVKAKEAPKGVSWHAARGKWVARIKVDYRTINLGRFDCPQAAHDAYKAAAEQYFGAYARMA